MRGGGGRNGPCWYEEWMEAEGADDAVAGWENCFIFYVKIKVVKETQMTTFSHYTKKDPSLFWYYS